MKINSFRHFAMAGLLSTFLAPVAYGECDHDHKGHHGQVHHQHTPVAMSESVSDQSLHQVPAVWQDHRGDSLVLRDLSGQAVIVTMIYSSCKTACPVLIEDVKRVYHNLSDAEQAKTRVLVISFDAHGDTPDTLNAFAQQLGGDLPGWHFVTGAASDIRTIAALLGIRYRENPAGGFDHANVIAVLNPEGEIHRRQEGLAQNPERMVAAVRKTLD